ncbi:iron ABC transporter permease [Ruminococcus sp. CLA-AA-H200]|uniref:Iron ABC transporter permease n=1 Tax=Ruminococcus turbiniformis TaxID=2881258 RepID=A0ABS8FXR7_9FIRM|nr:iron ABC transporter permease [Ruminococcus turbiniformis]MCC2254840.1 iron ABC transporter permease [Ruminococcus turbiniformis]
MHKNHSEIKNESRIRHRYFLLLLAMLIILFAVMILSFWVGYYPLSPVQVIEAFLSKFGYEGEILPQAVTIFWSIRLPRILSAAFIGAALAVAGSTYQGMFRNPLVSPDILGVSSGASLGAAFAILCGASNAVVQAAAFAGGTAAVAASYLISRKSAHSQTLSLVLTGSMIMALCNAGVTMIKYVADPNDVLQQITFWLMGSLTKTTMDSFAWSAGPMIVGLAVILILRWRINLLTLEEEEAKSLGINIRRYRLIFIVASTLLSASAVCLGGLIGWVGLMVPHMARSLVGADYGRLVPASAMLGAGYLVLMDDVARSVLSMELPLGVVTSIMGAPFFVYLIIKKKE